MGVIEIKTSQEQILGIQKNDPVILRKLYLNIFPKVKHHVLSNNGNEDQAKDIFQEAFVVCWKNIKDHKFSDNGNVEGYLYTIAKNKWTDYLRSADYKKTVSSSAISHLPIVNDEASIDEVAEEKNREALNLAVLKLGENCKKLLKFFYYERRSMNEISEKLNMTSASARNQKYRCMEKLRNLTLQIKDNG